MGLYRRGNVWWMSYVIDGRQHCESTGVSNKKRAKRILDSRRGEIADGRFNLLKSQSPKLDGWATKYLASVQHPNTRRRYESSKVNLISFFGEGVQLRHISSTRIEQFKR